MKNTEECEVELTGIIENNSQQLLPQYIRDIAIAKEWLEELIARESVTNEDLLAINKLLTDLLTKIRIDQQCQHQKITATPLEVDVEQMTVTWDLFCEGCSIRKEKTSNLDLSVPLSELAKAIPFNE
ncbi:hypothetical protein [Spiroplasma eriocheiris]|uniref:Uncharacterized protein n=1 Tax=Spiroplasma eriocheiris TaxID=315358 RepID=A0A0H3XHT2_9MOLU|nr:hypothetical protein [Spiroplasma eriocheiris]AKM53945.1 hypothetical protein SERIO_v1c03630 [Spiroplasma eriocheiris]